MADADDAQAVTEWDEKGNPIKPQAAGVMEWDEHGNPIGGATTPPAHEGALPAGSYQNRPKGPVLNANETPTRTAAKRFLGAIGGLGEHGELADSTLGTFANIPKSAGRFIANEWEQPTVGGRRGISTPLSPGQTTTARLLFPFHLGARGLEGIAGSAESAGADVYQGVKRNDPRAVAGGVGEAAGTIGQVEGAEATTGLLKPSLRLAGRVREGIGGAIHDPATGIMTKGSEALSRGGGAALGGAAGAGLGSTLGPGGTYAGAGIGATSGGLAGPALLEKAFPEPTSRIAAREEFAQTKTLTEAQEAAAKENTQRARAAKVEQTRLQREVDKAAKEAEDARNQHAEDLMRRQKEQDALDREEKRAIREAQDARDKPAEDLMRRGKEQDALDKAAEKAAKEAKDAHDQHAQDLVDRQKEQDSLDAKHAKALKALEDARQKELAANEQFIEQDAAARNRRGGLPQGSPRPFSGPRTVGGLGRSIILPGETIDPEAVKNAGSAAQATAERLQELARFGDKAAADELVRRRIARTGSPRPIDYGRVPLPQNPAEPPPIRVNREPVTPLRGPVSVGITTETDVNGTRWAISKDGYRVSIPKRIPDAEIEEYAGPKLAEQRRGHKGLGGLKQ